VLELVRNEALTVVATWELVEELAEVLRRPRLTRLGITESDVISVLAHLAPVLPTLEVDVQLRDPKDVPVVAAAVAGHADAIVTGDRDLLDNEELRAWLRERGVEVLVPAELLERLSPS
jgi:putative PIN family toxin of toxin-antitoxin system